MKIKNKKSFSIKNLIIPVIVLFVISGGVYAYVLSDDFFSTEPTNQEASLPEAQNDPVPEGPVTTDNTNKESLGEAPPLDEQTNGPAIILTTAKVNNDTLQVRALIQGVVNQGTCQLIATRNGQTFLSQSSAVQPGPSSSTCQGFDVPLDNTPNGTLSIIIRYSNGASVSTSQPAEVSVNR
jgi:hypothetical protein